MISNYLHFCKKKNTNFGNQIGFYHIIRVINKSKNCQLCCYFKKKEKPSNKEKYKINDILIIIKTTLLSNQFLTKSNICTVTSSKLDPPLANLFHDFCSNQFPMKSKTPLNFEHKISLKKLITHRHNAGVQITESQLIGNGLKHVVE